MSGRQSPTDLRPGGRALRRPLAADSGIGYLLQKSSLLLQTNRIFVALLTICILGFAVDRLFRFFVDRVLTRYMFYIAMT